MFQTLSQVIRTTKEKSTKLKIVQLRRGRCPLKQGTSGNRGKSKPSSTAPNPFSDYANSVPRTAYSTRIVPQQPFLQKQKVLCVRGLHPLPKRVASLLSGADQVGHNKTKSRTQPEAPEFVKDEYLLEQFE